jgi:hypothetical protein
MNGPAGKRAHVLAVVVRCSSKEQAEYFLECLKNNVDESHLPATIIANQIIRATDYDESQQEPK